LTVTARLAKRLCGSAQIVIAPARHALLVLSESVAARLPGGNLLAPIAHFVKAVAANATPGVALCIMPTLFTTAEHIVSWPRFAVFAIFFQTDALHKVGIIDSGNV
jgi:hypothetical protein